jgi:hypothetical protein
MEICHPSQATFEVIKIFSEAFADVRGHLIKRFVSEHRRDIVKNGAHEQHRRQNVSLGVRRVDLSAHANKWRDFNPAGLNVCKTRNECHVNDPEIRRYGNPGIVELFENIFDVR